MTLKPYEEMNAEQKLAYRMGLADFITRTGEQRLMTREDLIEIAKSMGGVEFETKAGRYLLVPIS